MSSNIAEQLVQEIEYAFDHIDYPGDDNLVDNVEDVYVETYKLFLAFKGKHWKEIAHEVLYYYRLDFSVFTPAAFRFYIPAYMIASLRGDKRDEIIQHVIWKLAPHQDTENASNEFLTKIEPLSSEQKAAIKKFVKHYAETRTHPIPADKKVEQFWENYSF
ncbi:MAG: hypothetical protein JNM70_14625 [Anaerolineae bacterium]|nr:hypothetical protein [Anaerolineae bacterium]